jgi:2-methylcitrate dehydratase PrpD
MGIGGEKFIEGLVVGYEIEIRVAESVNPSYNNFWYTTGTVGCFVATAAAGKIMNLSPIKLCWAMGNAGSEAAGSWEFQADASLTKPMHPGKER